MNYQLIACLCAVSIVGSVSASSDINKNTVEAKSAETVEVTKASVVEIEYDSKSKYQFSQKEKDLIKTIVNQAEKSVRAQLPDLTNKIKLKVTTIDRDLSQVGGVTGRTDSSSEVLAQISTQYPGGIIAAIKAGLPANIHHEFHHLVRGWTMNGNKFDAGIPIAAVNEGLAVVFSEKVTGFYEEASAYPKNVDSWVNEILDLPKYANYGEWMMLHSDGREAIGYKSGKYIVEQAMKKSGKNILELSMFAPYEILEMSGVIDNHVTSFFKMAEYYEEDGHSEKALEAYQRAYKISQQDNTDDGSRYLNRIKLINHPIVFSKDALKQLVGQYKGGKYNFTISKNGTALLANNKGWPQLELTAESKNRFFIRTENIAFEFVKGTDNQFNRLVLTRGDKIVEMNKVD